MTNDFRAALRTLLDAAAASLAMNPESASVEVTRDEKFGDLTTNAAMVWAKPLGKNPRVLAQEIIEQWQFPNVIFERAEIAGPGFINLRLTKQAFAGMMASILDEKTSIKYGHREPGHHTKKWIVEFVSANPTGPLNVVSARAAAIGDSLARILDSQGHEAHREFYVNDAGRQVRLFGASVLARMKQLQGEDVSLPEEGYQGEYVTQIAREAIAEKIPVSDPETLSRWSIERMIQHHQATMAMYRVEYQKWFHESVLHKKNEVNEVLAKLEADGFVYEQDGAKFLRTTVDGIDDKDRVVVTSQGNPTYIMADLAYHLDKYRRGFDRSINYLGPDHHGTIARLMVGLKMLGVPDGWHEIKLLQQVNLLRNGEVVKMSKRAGEIVTLDDLLEELGNNETAIDVARFFFLQRKVSTPLDFDLSLAVKQSDENPAFYVQYAHARICSILRQEALQEAILQPWQGESIALLQEPETRTVLRKALEYPLVLERCIVALDPNALTTYLTELAAVFHKFYHHHRVMGQEKELTIARVKLLQAVKNILADGLGLLGITAPEQM
ncbi:MAG: arginine--tRNA ligase [bacterium]|nr:arginine--tRNA ligase [bacterium]